ncbi:helix-turn-helix transcriptional regulator [Streptomyces kaniharaensis]|uniref:Helix-turn-helix transcriptional regulator n=1 Tax=Streptomyces kaniharaensis TaxID=212423 RepID=A0A6N7L198_9ACTN|nr:helix-turn-helix transcriptional regulator [Streptomyces kaniharaensis]MQS17520.1 helix-turn-helix transcriptional regulator [Streptomyces kaniharaensis]
MDVGGIGRRIAYWRERRGLTQEQVGRLVGMTRRGVQDIERGERQGDPRVSVVETFAAALQVRVEDLLGDGPPASAAQCMDTAELAAIRATLLSPAVLLPGLARDDARPDLERLRRNVSYGWTAFQYARFTSLGRVLPPLVAEAAAAAGNLDSGARQAAFSLQSMTYQLVVAVAVKYGDVVLATMAADRAVSAADRSCDPVAMAGAARHLVDAMTHQGRAAEGVRLAGSVADRLEGDLVDRGVHGVTVLGMLHLKAAVGAAALGSADTVTDLLAAAEESAARLGGDANALWTAFGPTNCAFHTVACLVALGEGAKAVAAAQSIAPHMRQALPRERRALFLVDLSRAQAQAGLPGPALETLLEAEREAPEEVRCRPRTHQLVQDLHLLVAGSDGGRLRTLAARCGLPA